jgi:hypothetical protein
MISIEYLFGVVLGNNYHFKRGLRAWSWNDLETVKVSEPITSDLKHHHKPQLVWRLLPQTFNHGTDSETRFSILQMKV